MACEMLLSKSSYAQKIYNSHLEINLKEWIEWFPPKIQPLKFTNYSLMFSFSVSYYHRLALITFFTLVIHIHIVRLLRVCVCVAYLIWVERNKSNNSSMWKRYGQRIYVMHCYQFRAQCNLAVVVVVCISLWVDWWLRVWIKFLNSCFSRFSNQKTGFVASAS